MSNPNDLSSYKPLYIKSANDCINAINSALAILAKDPASDVAIEQLHRNAHSLKSESLTMGYFQTTELAKIIEFIMQNVIDTKGMLSNTMLNDLKNAAAKLTESLAKIKDQNQEEELSRIIELLKKHIQ